MPPVPIQQAFELAVQHHQTGRLAEAEAIYRQILAVQPRHAGALHLLGVLAHQTRRNDVAVDLIRQAIAIVPENADFHSNLGIAFSAEERWEDAIAAYRRALQIQPDSAVAHYNLGIALKALGRMDEAIAAYQQALRLKPDYSTKVENNLAIVFRDTGRLDEALACYRRALAFDPRHAVTQSNLIYTLHFHPGHDMASIAGEQRRWEREFAEPLRKSHRPHANDRDPDRRLRIGYVSPNFSRHVICHFLTPLLEAHDHAGFEIHGYASVPVQDAITERMKKTADVWRDVLGVADEALAERIREDKIDILVDLTQHMGHNRLLVFARKPAPVQVAWLGYPGSTGLPEMDCRLTDAQMEPEGAAWSESVEMPVRLPDSWFCFDPIEEFPEPGVLPAQRAGHVTFGCLNTFCKVNDAVLERWVGVMRAVENSRLLLRCPQGAAQARVREFFAARGIAAERLELVAWTTTRTEFLKLFDRMDIALDPFPYNGGTTTCETLWMGIPVLTLPGEGIVARIGLSILSACGMPEFVAHTEEEYVRLAAGLAADLPRLADLRATLRVRMKASAFMDGPRFAKNMEHAYREMWRAWCAKKTAPVS